MSDGVSLYTHPENTRRNRSSVPCTSNCRNAPVSCSGSHGAVVSHADMRTIASPTRTASPGFIASSVAIPLRLLSNPIIADRSAIGVVPSVLTAATGGATRPMRTGAGRAIALVF